MQSQWVHNEQPKHLSFNAHSHDSIVTCLLFSRDRIISASDDHSIHVYSAVTGQRLMSLDGHEGGVWAIAVTRSNDSDFLVSGSTDRTVRIWDLTTGHCKYVFGGHTGTVRCLAIINPEWEAQGEGDVSAREKCPKESLIVTGSRDHSLRIWVLPKPDDPEYKCIDNFDTYPAEISNPAENPYHKLHLEGHTGSVRTLATHGRTVVSGSFDCNVRVWDIITGKCTRVLSGHTQKVYCVAYEPNRNQAFSGSMDHTVRIWDLHNGTCQRTLTGHESLVGLLNLSPSYLVSAAADSTLCIWDPETGKLRNKLSGHKGAVTCFQHDEVKILSGSDGALKMWNIRDGSFIRDLLTDITGIWQVVFEGRWCVAASHRNGSHVIDVWDFGIDEG